MTVTCRRSAPIDFAVNPAQDWSAEVDDHGDQEVHVTFRRRPTTIEVHARCVDGEPRTEVDEQDDD